MKYKVHSSVAQNVEVDATTADGRAIRAYAPGHVVELLPVDHMSGSITLRFVPASRGEHHELADKFRVGAEITATFA
jgi:hypothetical protein